MENNQPENLNSAPPIPPIGQTPIIEKSSSKFPIFLAIVCFVIGASQILLPIMLNIFVIPQIINTQKHFEINTTSNIWAYVSSALLILFGLANIYFGIKMLKSKRILKFGIINLIFSFLLQGILVAAIVISTIYPIYNLLSQATTPNETLSPTPPPADRPTANWKTYTNSKYGFSVEYPDSWTVSENIDGAVLRIDKARNPSDNKSPNNSVYFRIVDDPENLPIENKIQSPVEGIKLTFLDFTINGIAAKRANLSNQQGCTAGDDSVFIKKGTMIYEIQNGCGFVSASLFNQILSTFKFTDSGLTPTPTCMPRPACLDATPRCLIAEPASGWCPANQTSCNSDADCTSGSGCMAVGPVIAGQAPHKICVKNGSTVPL